MYTVFVHSSVNGPGSAFAVAGRSDTSRRGRINIAVKTCWEKRRSDDETNEDGPSQLLGKSRGDGKRVMSRTTSRQGFVGGPSAVALHAFDGRRKQITKYRTHPDRARQSRVIGLLFENLNATHVPTCVT